MSIPKDFVIAWRTQLGLSGSGSGSRRAKVGFLLAIAAGSDLADPIRQVGLYAATPARELAEQTRDHLATLGEGADNFRRELGELVPADERPKAPAVTA